MTIRKPSDSIPAIYIASHPYSRTPFLHLVPPRKIKTCPTHSHLLPIASLPATHLLYNRFTFAPRRPLHRATTAHLSVLWQVVRDYLIAVMLSPYCSHALALLCQRGRPHDTSALTYPRTQAAGLALSPRTVVALLPTVPSRSPAVGSELLDVEATRTCQPLNRVQCEKHCGRAVTTRVPDVPAGRRVRHDAVR